MKEVTFIVKTFERPACIKRLVRSIYRKYPNAIILIADDSRESCKRYFEKKYPNKELVVYELNKDQGLSMGRNYLIDRVSTEFFVLLDDDFVFDDKTDIETALELLKQKDLDILGGYLRNYAMREGLKGILKVAIQNIIKYEKPINYLGKINYSELDSTLYVNYIRKQFPEYVSCDLVLNFFVAKTKVVRDVNRWDDDLKLQEHTAFFFKAKKNGLRVGFSNKFSVQHKPIRVRDYGNYRNRDYTQVFMKKNNIKKIVATYDDGETKVVNYEEERSK